VTDRRLASVWVWTDYGGAVTSETDGQGRSRVRRYVLQYEPAQHHSMLASVQLLGRDDTSNLPPAEFTYQEITGSVSVTGLGALNDEVRELTESPDASLGTGLQDLVDLDGDGLVDLLLVDPSSFGDDTHRFIIGGGVVDAHGKVVPTLPHSTVKTMGESGWSDDQIASRGDHLTLTNSNVQMLDVDGDGAIELVHMPRAGLYQIYKVSCTGPMGNKACRWTKVAEVAGHPSIDLTVDAETIRLLDVNGDSLVDVVRTAGTRMEHWLNLGRYHGGLGKFGHVEPDGSLSDEPVTSCLLFKGGYIRFDDPRVKLADMNGDGLTDIVLVDYGQVAWWPNKGWGQWGEGSECTEGMTGSGRSKGARH
jgi:hypothetical protein